MRLPPVCPDPLQGHPPASVAKLCILSFNHLEESALALIFLSDWRLPEAGLCLRLDGPEGSE